MDTGLITGIIAVVIVMMGINAYFIAAFLKRTKEKDPGSDQGLQLLLQQMNELSRTVDARIGETNKQMGASMKDQFAESQKLVNQFIREITQMTEKVTRVEETGKQMVSFADQLKSLQDILKNPKQRGVLGEYYLETLLKNVLPPGTFEMQYAFKDGTIVDAIVRVKDKIIPIDSKFSLENYNRLIETRDDTERERLEKLFVNDLKNRIVETSKYVQPSEDTMDFAFMFIPHEAIYYDLLVNKIGVFQEDNENLIQRAAGKYRVIIVSPTSFLAYLQTVLQGLKALQIEESAKQIASKVGDLAKHLKAYEEYHRKMGTNLSTVVNQYNLSSKEFKKIDKDVTKISGEAIEIEVLAIDKPSEE